jgi:hypothetical protein
LSYFGVQLRPAAKAHLLTLVGTPGEELSGRANFDRDGLGTVISAKIRISIIKKATVSQNAKQVCKEINNEGGRVSYNTVLKVIKEAGIDLTEAASERMKRLHADPEFAARLAAGASERMKRLHADPEFAARLAAGARKSLKRLHTDPEFAARHAAAASARLKRLHADPEYASANSERMKRRRRDPGFAARQAEAARERMKRQHTDPQFEAKRIAGIRNAKAKRQDRP